MLIPQAGYLFPEIGRRRTAYLEANPDAQPIISLGIGDTTEPIDPVITGPLAAAASGLSTREGYSGYGAEQGRGDLRAEIAKVRGESACSEYSSEQGLWGQQLEQFRCSTFAFQCLLYRCTYESLW